MQAQALLQGVRACSPISKYLQVHHKLTGHCRVSQLNIYYSSAHVLLQKHFLRLMLKEQHAEVHSKKNKPASFPYYLIYTVLSTF